MDVVRPVQPPALTERQAAVLRFIGRFFATRQRPPTYRELCAEFGWKSTNAAHTIVRVLADKRVLELVGTRRGEHGSYQVVGLSPVIRAAVHEHVERLIGGGE